MTDIEHSVRSITDPAIYERHLSAFDLTDTEKTDLINVLYCLAIEAIESDYCAVDKIVKPLLANDFNRLNML